VPILTYRLYGEGLKQVGSMPINLGDQAEVDDWLAARRLPAVVDEGGFRSKPRLLDAKER
jgi:hypothetical protein